jgi:hypothetical protein
VAGVVGLEVRRETGKEQVVQDAMGRAAKKLYRSSLL